MAEDRATLLRAAKARSTKYGIAFKPGKGHLTPPRDFPTNETDYADPVNYAYPLVPEERLRAAVSYFNQRDQREAGGYTAAEWRIIGQRIAARATGKKYANGKVVDSEEKNEAKELDYSGVAAALSQLYTQYLRRPGNEEVNAWPIAVFPSGKAWFHFDYMQEPGDIRRNVLEADWVVEDGIVRITAWRPGTIEMSFTPLVAQAQDIERIEQVADPYAVTHGMKEIAKGVRRTAVLLTTCRLTGQPRWITVSSGSFPDRMGEIVTKDAQEFSVRWAREHKMYGPLRLAHLPHPFSDDDDVRTKWRALVGEFTRIFDEGLLPMLDTLHHDDLVTPWRLRNLVTMVGRDLAVQVARGAITADVGFCDFQGVYGGSSADYPGCFLVESGLWYTTPLAEKARAYFEHNPGEVSQGFLFDRTGSIVKGERVYPIYNGSLWRFERSLLPMGAAAFPATGYLDGAVGIATV